MAEIDFNAALAGDETYQAALRAIEASRTNALDQRNAVDYQGLINYGELPAVTDQMPQNVRDFLASIPSSIQGAVTSATAGGLSQLAQRLQTQRDAQSLMRGNLGERGIIRSGDYAYLTNKNSRAEQIARANDLLALLGGFNTAQSGYLGQLDTLRGDQANAANAAWQRMMDKLNADSAAAAAAQARADNQAFLDALLKQNQPTPTTTTDPTPVGPQYDAPPDPTWPAGGTGPVYPGVTTVIPDFGGIPVSQIPDTYMQGSAGQGSEYQDMLPFFPGSTSTIPDTQGSTETSFTPPAQQAFDESPNFLQGGGSDAAQSADSNPDPYFGYVQGSAGQGSQYSPTYAAPAPVSPVVPGYGGGSTAGQVRRNML